MEEIAQFPFFRLEFGRQGEILHPGQPAELLNSLAAVTDLIVLSHGWNNNIAEAMDLYTGFLNSARAVLPELPGLAGRKFAVAGVLWPSKRFTDQDLIPGGMASLGEDPEREVVLRALDELATLFDGEEQKNAIADAKADLERLDNCTRTQDEWVARILDLVDDASAGDRVEEGLAGLRSMPGSELLQKLVDPIIYPAPQQEGEGGALDVETTPVAERQGGAAGIGSLLSGTLGGAAKLLNLVTYYTMKDRAGVVGSTGVHDVLVEVQRRFPGLRLHLAGHSFGGRLVSACALGRPGAPDLALSSMALLQAAFSHYGFSNDAAHQGQPGFFRPVVTSNRVKGPVVITLSCHDLAVGYAYAIASRVSGSNAEALGDAGDEFGGIGRNGAQLTPEAVSLTLQQPGAAYALAPGKLHNLNADAIITGHGDVANQPVAYACLAAMQ